MSELYPDVAGNTLRELSAMETQGNIQVQQGLTIPGTCREWPPIPDEPAPCALHPAVQRILRFFTYGHLPEELASVSAPFCQLAYRTAYRSPKSPETTVALRKLLEAKDAAVRAVL